MVKYLLIEEVLSDEAEREGYMMEKRMRIAINTGGGDAPGAI